MRVVSGARDHVPVQVRYLIAERGEVHLLGLEEAAQRGFRSQYDWAAESLSLWRQAYSMMRVTGNQPRTLAAKDSATDAEKLAAYNSFVANTGT